MNLVLYRHRCKQNRIRRGGILITTIMMSAVIAAMIAGLGTLLVSYYSRTSDEMSYADALNHAEFGLNYELKQISTSVASADMPGTSSPLGTAIPFGNGTCYVYCTMMDGTTTWDKSVTPFKITSTAIVKGVSRTLQITAKTSVGNSFAGLFAVGSGTMTGNASISGSVSTNGTLNVGSNNSITGGVIFNGAAAGWAGGTPSIPFTALPNAVVWPTSSQVALGLFPNSGATAPGGYSYLAVHNDNLLAVPPIVGGSISLSSSQTVTLVGKPGGSNYYLTNLNMSGQSYLTFNNLLGPITIWYGPVGGNKSFTLTGGSAAVKMGTDASKAVKIYVATTGVVTLTGGSETDVGIYDVTGGTSLISLAGNSAMTNATVICDRFSMTGTSSITTPSGYFATPGLGGYQFSGGWHEPNPMP